MKSTLICIVLLLFSVEAAAQNLTSEERLFYTCKAWGLVKYMHPAASNCEVDWDGILIAHLPAIRAAVNDDAFNTALRSMLAAAGPVPVPTLPPPLILPAELSRNLDTLWFRKDALATDIQNVLDSIVTLFRPHQNCHVRIGSGAERTYLMFPSDDPILDVEMLEDFPDEDHRLLLFFTYWNIIRFFSPNNHILDVPWDTVLSQNVSAISSAADMQEFHTAFLRVPASLQDLHVDGLTWAFTTAFGGKYIPKLVIRHGQDGYIVVKSGCPPICKGDVILAVNGKTVDEWEDSLRAFIPAGNDAVLKMCVRVHMFRGDSATYASIVYRDSSGNSQNITAERQCSVIDIPEWNQDYYPIDSLKHVRWQRLESDIGYVHMGNITYNDVNAMYATLSDTKAIIFDIRNYPQGMVPPAIAEKLLPAKRTFATYLKPDLKYPGTLYWDSDEVGPWANPAPYGGKVIVLCNEKTVSHAEWSCMIFRTVPGCIVVGSQTAGADGNNCRLQLARDVQTGYSGFSVYYPDGTPTQRIGIIPDSIVTITAAAVRAGRDLVLEKAMSIARSISTGVEAHPVAAPARLTLQQNYPNPFNPGTSITFSLTEAQDVTLSVVDLYGREIRRLLDSLPHEVGTHTAIFNATGVPSGVYFVRLAAGGQTLSRKMVLLR
jgi:C-terminal processing protease CtpA/Prc